MQADAGTGAGQVLKVLVPRYDERVNLSLRHQLARSTVATFHFELTEHRVGRARNVHNYATASLEQVVGAGPQRMPRMPSRLARRSAVNTRSIPTAELNSPAAVVKS